MNPCRLFLLSLICCIFSPAAWAKPAQGETPNDIAESVVNAHAVNDAKTIQKHAQAKDGVDPWLVAEALLAREDGTAAAVFGKATHGVAWVGPLDAWIQQRLAHPRTSEPWSRYQATLAQLGISDVDADGAKAQGGLNEVLVVSVRLAQARALLASGKQGAAVEQLVNAGTSADAIGWHNAARKAWDAAGLVRYQAQDMKAAAEFWSRCVRSVEARGIDQHLLDGLNKLGMAEQSLARYADSKKHLARALDLARASKNPSWVSRGLSNLAITLRRMGSLEAARVLFTEALHINDAHGAKAQVSRVLSDLGGVMLQKGALSAAVRHYEHALEIMIASGREEDAARPRLGLAAVYTRLGRPKRALALVAQSAPFIDQTKDRRLYAGLLITRAVANERAENLDACEQDVRLGLAFFDRPGEQNILARFQTILSGLSIRREDFDGALRSATAAVASNMASGDELGTIQALTNLGLVQTESEPTQAIVTLREAMTRADASEARELSVWTRSYLAAAYAKAGQHQESVVIAREAVARSTHALQGHADQDAGTARSRKSNLYDLGIASAVIANDPASIHYFIEAGRGAAFVEALGGRDALSWLPMTTALRVAEAKAFSARSVAARSLADALRSQDHDLAKKAVQNLRQAEAAFAEANAAIARAGKATSGAIYPKPVDVAALQRVLRPDDVVVSYHVGTDHGIALVTSSTEMRVVKLASREVLLNAVRAFRLDASAEDTERALNALRQAVVQPLGLGAYTKRVIVSQGALLAFVPLGALFSVPSISSVPSASALVRLSRKPSVEGAGILAIGDPDYLTPGHGSSRAKRRRLVPLPATRAEAQLVGDVVLLGSDATPTRFLAEVSTRPRWSALHIACHGILDSDDPYASSLAMTPEPSTGGHLTVRDVMRSSLPTNLVVLSACESGRGRVLRGEGVIGLVRAFLLAGSQRVIGSLWRVDDAATAALMKKFYALRAEGTADGEALAKAQAHIRMQPKWSHPRYWAAWILWGLP